MLAPLKHSRLLSLRREGSLPGSEGSKMSKTITSFFKPLTTKKRSAEGDEKEADTKKLKTDVGCDDSSISDVIAKQARVTPALSANMGPSWFKALQSEFTKEYFKKLSAFLAEERRKHTIYPPEDQVYTWTRMCSLHEVKVVILGQDPYHGPRQAHGLCFSVQVSIESVMGCRASSPTFSFRKE